jgi:hypothetical protein
MKVILTRPAEFRSRGENVHNFIELYWTPVLSPLDRRIGRTTFQL